MRKINWGVLGTAGIAKGCTIPGMQQAENCNLYAIAGRSLKKAETFREAFGFTKAYGSYEALLADPERKLIHLLSLEDGMYVLSTYDLDSGTQSARLELLPQDPDRGTYCTIYRHLGDQLLLYIQGHLILTDAAGETLLLTAPNPKNQNYNVANFNPETYDLYFDGETLFIAGFYSSRPYSFAITAWSEGAQTYYGEYSCTLNEGNENWYYSPVELTDLTLKGG